MQSVVQQGFQYQTGVPVAYNPMIYPVYGVNTAQAASVPTQTQLSYPGSYYLMSVPYAPTPIYPATPIQNSTVAPTATNAASNPVKPELVPSSATPVAPVDNKVSEAPPKMEQVKQEAEMPKSDAQKPEQSAPEAPKEDKTQMPKANPLTNEFLMTLENFLNSQDISIRKQGTAKVLEKVKELTNDGQVPDINVPQGLKNLVNKALQDPDIAVRTLAFGILNYTNGDQLTINILNRYMASNSNYGADAISARTALFKMAEKGINLQSSSPQAAVAS